MPTAHITKKFIENLAPQPGRQILVYDTTLRGFGYRASPTGGAYFCEAKVNRRTVRLTIGKGSILTPEQARRIALSHLAEMSQGVDPREERRAKAARSVTLQEALDGYLAAKGHLSQATHDNYRRTVAFYLKGWANKPIGDINRAQVQAEHQRLSRKHGGVSANNAFRHFRAFYNFVAASVGDLPPNPVSVISQSRSWAPERRRQGHIPPHALPAWHQAVLKQNDVMRDLFLVTLFTGMRRSEVCNLRWDHLDLANRTLTIPVTKNGDPLVLPLSLFLTDLLTARRKADPKGAWVFPSYGKTGRITETKIATERVGKLCGVTFTMHDLRRTFVTIAESLDIPHYALKRLLNHRSNGDVTAGYIIISTDRLRAPVEKIAGHIEELLNGNHGAV